MGQVAALPLRNVNSLKEVLVPPEEYKLLS